MTVGVALVGCGLVGVKRAAALPDDSRLVACFDTDEARRDALAAAHPGARALTSVEGAVGADGVDLVVVATPHRELPRVAALALEADRDLLVEKPGGADLAGVREIATLATTRGRSVRVGFNHRFHPALLEAKRLVTEGGYGPLLHLRGRYGHGGRLGYEREWRSDRSISGGGELIDQGVHLIDLTRFLVGEVTLSFAQLTTAFWPMDVEDNAFLALRCATGATAWLHASWTEWKNLFSLEITLERAKIEVAGLGGSYGTETLTLHEMRPEMGPPDTTVRTFEQPDDSWSREMDDVLAGLHGGPVIGATIDDAVANFVVIDDAYRSQR